MINVVFSSSASSKRCCSTTSCEKLLPMDKTLITRAFALMANTNSAINSVNSRFMGDVLMLTTQKYVVFAIFAKFLR